MCIQEHFNVWQLFLCHAGFVVRRQLTVQPFYIKDALAIAAKHHRKRKVRQRIIGDRETSNIKAKCQLHGLGNRHMSYIKHEQLKMMCKSCQVSAYWLVPSDNLSLLWPFFFLFFCIQPVSLSVSSVWQVDSYTRFFCRQKRTGFV